jgi:hypothetical protein
MRSQSSRPNLNLATWPFGLENGEYYIQGALGYNSRTAPRADPKPNPAFFGC